MTQDFKLILDFLNAWPDIPCRAHFEGRANSGTPDLILEAQKGGTALDSGRNFRLIYRIFPDPEGEFLYAAAFFDEIDRYFADNTAATGISSAPIAWIKRRSAMVSCQKNSDGSQSFGAEYTLFAGTTRDNESTITPSGKPDSGEEDVRMPYVFSLNGLPMNEENGLQVLSAEGMLAPDYLLRSQPLAFGVGSVVTAYQAIGRTIRLTAKILTEQGRKLLGEAQKGAVLVTAADEEGKIYRSRCRFAACTEKNGGKTVVELSSPNPFWESGKEITTFGQEMTVSLDGQSTPIWTLHMTTGSSALTGLRLTLNGNTVQLAGNLAANGEFLWEDGVLWQVIGGEKTRLSDFAAVDQTDLICGENRVTVSADSGRPATMVLSLWERYFSI